MFSTAALRLLRLAKKRGCIAFGSACPAKADGY